MVVLLGRPSFVVVNYRVIGNSSISLCCLFVVMAPGDWHMAEYFYDLLKPNVNFIPYAPETFQVAYVSHMYRRL
jgi:hypothetical protein